LEQMKQFSVRRGLWLLLAIILASAAVLAGCSSSNNNTSASSPAAASATPVSSASAEPSPTVDPVQELKPVELVWYLRMSKPNNADAVMAKLNEMIKAKINATVEFRFVAPADYNSKMKLAMAAQEEYDLVWTSSWVNKFAPNVSRGAYIALDEYIAQYPAIQNMYANKDIWGAVTIDGKIMGIPNQQIMGEQPGLLFLKDIVDKEKIDVNAIRSLDDLTSVMQTVKDNNPDVYPARNGSIINTAFGEYHPEIEGYKIDEKTMTVIEDYDETVRLPRYKLAREWNQKGFFPPDVATMKNEEDVIKAGKLFSRYSRYLPGGEATLNKTYGRDFKTIATGPAVINIASVQSTITAVSATSKNPDRAVMLYNLLLTDKDIYNTLVFGIEGKDYVKLTDNRIGIVEGGYSFLNWEVGSVFNSYVFGDQEDDVWEQTKALNDSSVLDPLLLFSFNREPVETELAKISTVRSEFDGILTNGLDDVDKVMKQYRDKLKVAGEDAVIAEINKQLAEWKSKK